MFRPFRRRVSPWYTNYEGVSDYEYGREPEEIMARETGRERYYRQIRELQEELEITHDEARRRWSDYYHRGGQPKRAAKKIALAVRASLTTSRVCPFCRDDVAPDPETGVVETYTCPTCQTHYHLDCFDAELGGKCATLGCATRRVIGRPLRTQLEVGRERLRAATQRTPEALRPRTRSGTPIAPRERPESLQEALPRYIRNGAAVLLTLIALMTIAILFAL